MHGSGLLEKIATESRLRDEERQIRLQKNENRENAFLVSLESIVYMPVDDTKPTIKRNSFSKMPPYSLAEIEGDTAIFNSLADYIVFDVETTGLKPNTNRIIEICIVKFRGFKPVEYMISLVNPSVKIPIKISDINGITNEMVEDAPMFQNIAQSIIDYIGDEKILVAHNMPFDLEFLYCSGVNLFTVGGRKYIDTLSLARNCLAQGEVEQFSLSALSDYFNILYSKRHRRHPKGSPKSISDCLATGYLFQHLLIYNTLQTKDLIPLYEQQA